jgi:hypothetical protein
VYVCSYVLDIYLALSLIDIDLLQCMNQSCRLEVFLQNAGSTWRGQLAWCSNLIGIYACQHSLPRYQRVATRLPNGKYLCWCICTSQYKSFVYVSACAPAKCFMFFEYYCFEAEDVDNYIKIYTRT